MLTSRSCNRNAKSPLASGCRSVLKIILALGTLNFNCDELHYSGRAMSSHALFFCKTIREKNFQRARALDAQIMHLQKCAYDVRVKVLAGIGFDVGANLVGRQRLAIGTIGDQGIPDVDHCKDARRERNFHPF